MLDDVLIHVKTFQGICENCLPFNANCKNDMVCCSKKCEDRGGYKQCGPTAKDRRKIIAAEKKVNKVLIKELKDSILSGKKQSKKFKRYYI